MADSQHPEKSQEAPLANEADLAQAFKEITRGEQTATALENHLTSLESKIEALLAQANENVNASKAMEDDATSDVPAKEGKGGEKGS